MKNAIDVLHENYAELGADFKEYFPELVNYSKVEMESLIRNKV
jgi:hypothetical protein